MKVHIIGAGLAGSEAAYQVAKRNIPVILYDMKPHKKSSAHQIDGFAELVCSNSLRADGLANAVGVLKAEMAYLDSLIIKAARATSVPAGGSLAVDRHLFSEYVTKTLKEHPMITFESQEITSLDVFKDDVVIVATGPLTSDGLSDYLKDYLGEDYFHFYDAAAPIIEKDSIDMSKAYVKSRYDKGTADYINCPMTKEVFEAFYDEVMASKKVPINDIDRLVFFEGCMPFEEVARRGPQTLLFGAMKPVGLEMPDGTRPYAVVQLRQDNAVASLYNLVGFQTRLTWPEQKRIIQMIPGLEQASIVRYGVMHRNTFINAPQHLLPTYQLKKNPRIFLAGQMTGVEGYVESAASGLVAGINAVRLLQDNPLMVFDDKTVIGSMAHYITTPNDHFQPMNANFGIVAPLEGRVKKKEKKAMIAARALETLKEQWHD